MRLAPIAAIAVAVLAGVVSAQPQESERPLATDPAINRPVAPTPRRPPRADTAPQVPVATAPPSLDDAPPPENFVAPGLAGLYAELRRAEAANRGRRPPRPLRPEPLAPYERYQSPETPADARYFAIGQIVVKFIEGSGVRKRDGTLVGSGAEADVRSRLARSGLEPSAVDEELATFNKIVAEARGKVGRAAPEIDDHDLDLLRRRGESRRGNELADLTLFYFVHLDHPTAEQALALLDAVRKLRIVETAYFQPIPFNAADIPPQTNIDVTGAQGYFGVGPSGPATTTPPGIDVDYARLFQGGRGGAVRIADIEHGWHDGHEDLPAMGFRFGVNWGDSHGTAVLGEIAAVENGLGANGLAPDAIVGWSSVTALNPFESVYFYSVANALLRTASVLQPGDIALIEQQFQHPFVGFACSPATDPCNDCTIPPWVAVEEFANEHAAISAATAAGIVVVEAAGNGRMPVTPASPRDSGAIVVGASDAFLRPACWSNFGARVDVHAWGMSVGTLGYGGFFTKNGIVEVPTLRMNGQDANQWYTLSFSGTSSASPIVVGAAAIVQATRVARGLPKLDSLDMRALLASTGTPQAPGTTPNIGPLPNLRAALASFIPDSASFVRQSPPPTGSITPGATFSVSETFRNSGGAFWVGGHTLSVAPSGQSGVQQFSGPPLTLGTAAAPIGPGAEVTRQFTVGAPSQPGTYSLSFFLRNGAGQVLASAPSQTVVVAAPSTAVDNASVAVLIAPGTLPDRVPMTVAVAATNTGTTTWAPATHDLRLQRFNRISLPRNSVALAAPVAPGQSVTLTFTVVCNGTGTGAFSAQMNGPSGVFGQTAARTIVCQ